MKASDDDEDGEAGAHPPIVRQLRYLRLVNLSYLND